MAVNHVCICDKKKQCISSVHKCICDQKFQNIIENNFPIKCKLHDKLFILKYLKEKNPGIDILEH